MRATTDYIRSTIRVIIPRLAVHRRWTRPAGHVIHWPAAKALTRSFDADEALALQIDDVDIVRRRVLVDGPLGRKAEHCQPKPITHQQHTAVDVDTALVWERAAVRPRDRLRLPGHRGKL